MVYLRAITSSVLFLFASLSAVGHAQSSGTTMDAYDSLRAIQPGFAVHTNLKSIADPINIPPVKKTETRKVIKKTYKNKKNKLARTAPSKRTSKSSRKQRIDVIVDLSDQNMQVKVGGVTKHKWKISSGREGHRTPTGWYKPTRMYREYYSKKYYNSPMPNSIFYSGGYAIHGTFQTSALGYTASHGCVRLSPQNAKRLYDLVQKNGRSRTHIRIKK